MLGELAVRLKKSSLSGKLLSLMTTLKLCLQLFFSSNKWFVDNQSINENLNRQNYVDIELYLFARDRGSSSIPAAPSRVPDIRAAVVRRLQGP